MGNVSPMPPKKPTQEKKIVNSVTINVEANGKIHLVGPSKKKGGIDYLACILLISKGIDVIQQLLADEMAKEPETDTVN